VLRSRPRTGLVPAVPRDQRSHQRRCVRWWRLAWPQGCAPTDDAARVMSVNTIATSPARGWVDEELCGVSRGETECVPSGARSPPMGRAAPEPWLEVLEDCPPEDAELECVVWWLSLWDAEEREELLHTTQ
jgi:hypothetical protein